MGEEGEKGSCCIFSINIADMDLAGVDEINQDQVLELCERLSGEKLTDFWIISPKHKSAT
jgi:hypothetical protein